MSTAPFGHTETVESYRPSGSSATSGTGALSGVLPVGAAVKPTVKAPVPVDRVRTTPVPAALPRFNRDSSGSTSGPQWGLTSAAVSAAVALAVRGDEPTSSTHRLSNAVPARYDHQLATAPGSSA